MRKFYQKHEVEVWLAIVYLIVCGPFVVMEFI